MNNFNLASVLNSFVAVMRINNEKVDFITIKFDLLRETNQVTIIGKDGRIADCDFPDIAFQISAEVERRFEKNING